MNKTGYLKAIWPEFLGCVFEVWPAPGARASRQKCGVRGPPQFARLSRAPGAGQTSKMHPSKSGQTAFKYPVKNRNGRGKIEAETKANEALSVAARGGPGGQIPGPGRTYKHQLPGGPLCLTQLEHHRANWVPEGNLAGFLGVRF